MGSDTDKIEPNAAPQRTNRAARYVSPVDGGELPRVLAVRQIFSAPRIDDVESHVFRLLDEFGLAGKIRPGQRIGLTAGSRGIRDLAIVLRALIARLRGAGAEPFVVPCMGSHGEATAEGQARLLAALGITEASVGAPIVSSMEVEEIGRTALGDPVVVDRNLAHADGIVVVHRVKPHPDFRSDTESGLVKMMAVGMGKHRGAVMFHRLARRRGLPTVLAQTAAVALARLPIVAGVGIVENQRDETAVVEITGPENLVERERAMLRQARTLQVALPFDSIDILLIDEIGKEISGAGMDTDIVARVPATMDPKPERPVIQRIVVRRLSEATHGNAVGIGLVDFTTRRLVDAIDHTATAVNCITGLTPEYARIPIFFETDREALQAARETCDVDDPSTLRLVWIANTAELEDLWASEAYLEEIDANPSLERRGDPIPLPFDRRGDLPSARTAMR